MWRALFLAIGITLILTGAQLFFVEQLEVSRIRGVNPNPNQGQFGGQPNSGLVQNPFQQASYQNPLQPPKSKTFLYTPKDWMPWSLLAVGSIIMIYTFTIPNRNHRE